MTGTARDPEPAPGQPNRLAREKSPYLLQHAQNPVDWYPWGEEAFRTADREDKPVFLSIGYATCHWCHVMARESFADKTVAALLNRDFICIKVDREERPDIDSVYMAACQLMTGQGGWPLTIIMTPEKQPFFAATYIPKEGRYGSAGLLDLLPRVAAIWRDQRENLQNSAGSIAAALAGSRGGPAAGGLPGPDGSILAAGFEALALRFDPANGGFGGAPKFPTPHTLLFLLRYGKLNKNPRATAMAEKTIRAIRMGGIHDHLGGGIHRYSTDARWRVPHFEKMLYDQALFLMAVTEAYAATRDPEYRLLAEDIAGYVLRDLTSADGSFRSAEDADSEGAEGTFYLWTLDELKTVLGSGDARIAATAYNATAEGTFDDPDAPGRNILHVTRTGSELARALDLPEPGLTARLGDIRSRLFQARARRIRPLCDDKVLTDWNGLMIAALADAGRVFGNKTFIAAAETAMQILLSRMQREDGGLLHRYRDGEASIPGFADDYAFTILGLLRLYGATFRPGCLADAIRLERYFEARFRDGDGGGFFSVSDTAEPLLVRRKEIYDGALPSGNAVACENLLVLAQLTGDIAFRTRADELIRAFLPEVSGSPAAHCWFLCALSRALLPSQEVVIAGPPGDPGTQALIDALGGHYLPGVAVLLRNPQDPGDAVAALAPFTRDMAMIDKKPAAYVCTGGSCRVPTADTATMLEFLAGNPAR